jgi:hypothetical protein
VLAAVTGHSSGQSWRQAVPGSVCVPFSGSPVSGGSFCKGPAGDASPTAPVAL